MIPSYVAPNSPQTEMMRFLLIISAVAFGYCDVASARDECTHSWTRGRLKSFKQVESEINGQAAGGKILRVALCKGQDFQYYRVKVLTAAGAVRSIRVPAQ